jgi:putative MATE family efflux protein
MASFILATSMRSPYDRQILRLALPALGALAAEPTYLLVDTAIVGHLGTLQLAALALAAAILGIVVNLCNFLAYGTTAQVARLHGAARAGDAGEVASQALYLALAIGIGLGAILVAAAQPIAEAMNGGGGPEADAAARYLRIATIGLPFALIALSGQGYLRGTGDLRSPLIVLVAANLLNVVLEVWFVYGLDLGLDGSAAGTVIAQAGMGAAFVWLLLRAPASSRRPNWARVRALLRTGGHLLVRTGALLACFTLAAAVAARFGEVDLAANQIAFGLFIFLALVLDSIAIAGQVLVGQLLGGGDARGAWAAARRMCGWSVVVGVAIGVLLIAGTKLIPQAFTDDPAVLDQAAEFWPLFALMLPAGALVFALDGILIGAGDTRFLAWAMVGAAAVFIPLALAALAFDWGLIGIWAALNALMLARLAPLAMRFAGRRWAVVGATAAPG